MESIENPTEEQKKELRGQYHVQEHLNKKIDRTFKVMRLLPLFTGRLGIVLTSFFYCFFVDPEKYSKLDATKNLDEGIVKKNISELKVAWEFTSRGTAETMRNTCYFALKVKRG